MKPTALVDVDGVLGEFAGEAVRFCNYYGRQPLGKLWTLDDVTSFDIFAALGCQHLHDRFVQHLIDTDYCRSMQILPGAQDFVAELRTVAEVVFCTSPHSGVPCWDSSRRAWLREHFQADKDHIVQTSAKYRVHGDYLIDDKIENVEAFERAGGQGLLLTRPWNRRSLFVPRVNSYADVLAIVREDLVAA